jgi:thiamine biosynthesis lipoprotein
MPSSLQKVERARPVLGTRVAVRVYHASASEAVAAVESVFAEIALIHQRMSFHGQNSDVSLMNREAFARPVRVHPYTYEVLQWAQKIAEDTDGVFDVTVAALLVKWGFLPRPPDSRRLPDPKGSWRDIELLSDSRVRFHRELWVDLGGIAKGYAVDKGTDKLRQLRIVQACINAGGDLRVLGNHKETIRLQPRIGPRNLLPMVELADGSLASSSGRLVRKFRRGAWVGPHVHGKERQAIGTHDFVCVLSGLCVVADALTKVALAIGHQSQPLLQKYESVAYHCETRQGWQKTGLDT